MSTLFEKIEKDALQLSRDEQIQLGQELIANAFKTETEIEKEWRDEAKRRLAAYDRGDISALPGEDVMREAYVKYGLPKS